MRYLRPNFHIHVSVRDLHIPTISLPILLQENMWTDPGNMYKSLTDQMNVNVEIRTEATQFLFWEYIKGFSLHCKVIVMRRLHSYLDMDMCVA